MKHYDLYKQYRAEVDEGTLHDKLLSIFGSNVITGKFKMKNGQYRSIKKAKLIPNTRTNKSICFKDMAIDAIRSISVTSSHILLQSGDLRFELKN